MSVLPAAAQTSEQVAKLLANDGAADDHFGSSVALSANTALIGAYQDDPELNAGSVYVFVRDALGNWTQQARLLADDGALGDFFGSGVAISGDTALIGAQQDGDSDPNTDQGSAYVFVRDALGNWTQQAKLLANDGDSFDVFGFSVAVSGDTAIIGALGDGAFDGSGSGAAYVFVRDGTSWNQQAKLVEDDAANRNFGISVAVSGDTAVVGASSGRGESGAAYVFERNGTSWSLPTKLLAGDGAAGVDRLTSVALSDNIALIGSYQSGGAGSDSGSASVFVRSGTSWVKQETLMANDAMADDRFGNSVAVSGDMAVIGAVGDDDLGSGSGSAYVFVRNGTSWVQQDKLLAGDGAADDRFGGAVALFGNTAVISAEQDDDLGNDSGSAYVFSFEPFARKAPVAIFILLGEDEE